MESWLQFGAVVSLLYSLFIWHSLSTVLTPTLGRNIHESHSRIFDDFDAPKILRPFPRDSHHTLYRCCDCSLLVRNVDQCRVFMMNADRYGASHVSVLETEYHPYIWTLVAVWCFERFARFVRLAYCNMHLLRSPNRACLTRTTATYQREANVIRLEVVPGSETLRPAPGQHYFIYQPMKFRGYENHAFSLASWSVDNEIVSSSAGSSGTLVSPGTKVNDELDLAARPIPENPHASGQQQSAGNEVSQYKFVFLIRPFAGWTRRLCDECLRSESSIDVKVLLEGPYGNRAPIHNYENALFIAGGTGIAAILPYIQDHLRRISPNGISTRTRSIKLIWSTKESGFVREVALKELLPALGHEDFAFDFFTTSASESSECSDIDPKISRPPHVKIIAGRPDIRSVIHDTVVDVRGNDRVGGRIAVMVSGPAGMADTARQSVHQALKAGNREIDYYEETFGW